MAVLTKSEQTCCSSRYRHISNSSASGRQAPKNCVRSLKSHTERRQYAKKARRPEDCVELRPEPLPASGGNGRPEASKERSTVLLALAYEPEDGASGASDPEHQLFINLQLEQGASNGLQSF